MAVRLKLDGWRPDVTLRFSDVLIRSLVRSVNSALVDQRLRRDSHIDRRKRIEELKLLHTLAVICASVVSIAIAPTASAAARSATTSVASSQTARGKCSAAYFHGDLRLGPLKLAKVGADGRELLGYRRIGGLSVRKFLATYWNSAGNSGKGGWDYPPDSGYVIGSDGQPIEFHLALAQSSDIDRYGSEHGSFLSPAGLPYSMRSIPPQNLDSTPPASCDYHDYEVIKRFSVDAGPIAPWFGQPGYGLQYQLDPTLINGAPASINVMWLVNNGYLKPVA